MLELLETEAVEEAAEAAVEDQEDILQETLR
jgi:hypothetical protein